MKITVCSSGYLRKSNSRKRSSFIHTQAAEEKIKRKLGKKEIVHHVDEDKTNNDNDNILVLRNEGYHKLIHSNIPCEIFETKDGSCVVIKEQYKCPYCGRLFEPKSADDVYCDMSCYLANKSKNIPSPAELKQLVWSKPSSQLSKIFGVSDTSIRKWCDKYGISKPPRGYWQKKVFDKL